MAKNLDLKTVRRELEQWRRQRKSRSEQVPQPLRRRIVQLVAERGWEETCRELPISKGSVAVWRREQASRCDKPRAKTTTRGSTVVRDGPELGASSSPGSKPAISSFVELIQPIASGGNEVAVELIGPTGVVLRVRGKVDSSGLQALAQSVVVGGAQ